MSVVYSQNNNTLFVSGEQELLTALLMLKAVFPTDETSIAYKIINRPNRAGEIDGIFSYQLSHQSLSEPLLGRNLERLISKLFAKKRITTVEQYIRIKAYNGKGGVA